MDALNVAAMSDGAAGWACGCAGTELTVSVKVSKRNQESAY